MKKILLFAMAALILGSGFIYGDYYNRHNVYDNYAYADFEFRLENAAYHMDRYQGRIYYFHHPRANVYFVLVGQSTFVVPAYTFRSYMHRDNFEWLSRSAFIALSMGGLDYYDSFLRFGFYFDFFDNYRWDQRHHRHLRSNFRNYYNGRRSHRHYSRNRTRIMSDYNRNRHSYSKYSDNRGQYRNRDFGNHDRRSSQRSYSNRGRHSGGNAQHSNAYSKKSQRSRDSSSRSYKRSQRSQSNGGRSYASHKGQKRAAASSSRRTKKH